jgi:PAS domain S-box-containing protein
MLVETMNEGILVLNEKRCVSFTNEKLCALLGIAKDEIAGRAFDEFLHPESRENFIKQQMLRREGCADSYEFTFLKSSGEKVFVLSSPTPMFSGNGAFNGSYEIITNISNIKLIEMQLVQSQKMETIGVLAAGLAHEINTPLQYVIGNFSFLKDALFHVAEYIFKIREVLGSSRMSSVQAAFEDVERMYVEHDIAFIVEEAPSALRSSLEGLDRIAAIVSSVKQFAHPDANELVPVDVNRELVNAVNISTNEWKYTAEVHTEFDENLPLLPCVASDFNQAILNLIINAAHAIQDKHDGISSKGRITIKTKHDKHHVFISIADNGIGIPVAIQNKIFNPFFTTKVVGKGTGMGLAMVLKIIEKHKGKIWFDSREGEGTTFFVQIPILDLQGMSVQR